MLYRLTTCFLLAFLAGGFFAAPQQTLQLERTIDIREFGRLFASLSEPEGYFDSDNLISNEKAYLQILPVLRRLQVTGGAYIGVGPDQNYSYIAEIRPALAIIMDIRRQNALQHLYFKALFELSGSRTEFLERLFGRELGPRISGHDGISALLDEFERIDRDPEYARRKRAEAASAITAWNMGLSGEDMRKIDYVARAFMDGGPQLKFTSYNRAPRRHHPTYRELLEEADPTGRQANYLADDERFNLVRAMHRENRILPIVADFGSEGSFAPAAVELRRRGLSVRCFYASNVEYYLFRGRSWEAYVRNLRTLPLAENACIIRTFAGRWFPHPAQLPGYYMVTVAQTFKAFLEREANGQYRSYWDLISQDYLVR